MVHVSIEVLVVRCGALAEISIVSTTMTFERREVYPSRGSSVIVPNADMLPPASQHV